MFDSDMTCCICRVPGKATQIHHIDADRSNTMYENLAVVCLDCHSKVHTNVAFGRNISKELVTMFNENWRRIVAARHRELGIPSGFLELRQEVLLELEIICTDWKMSFMRSGGLTVMSTNTAIQSGKSPLSWEFLLRLTPNPYSPELWEKVRWLALDETDRAVHRIETLLASFPQGVTTELQVFALRVVRQVHDGQDGFRQAPRFAAYLETLSDKVKPDKTTTLRNTTHQTFNPIINAFAGLIAYVQKESESLASEKHT